jgi:RNA polymerase sigma factor (sigma-70 family)
MLLSELPNIRDPKSLGGWLIKVTSHKCFHWGRRERLPGTVAVESEDGNGVAASGPPDEFLFQIEREQILREAMMQINPRCRELMQMLFYQNPPLPYDEVAKSLGLARGSIGFIRLRCLKKLRSRLEERGFR